MTLQAKYVDRVLRAPSKREKVMGFQVQSKLDLRYSYMDDLKNLAEVAKQNNDEPVLDFIKGMVSDDDTCIESLRADIAAL
tara:strand:+ start:1283 stop:1525 length:243 start_codon:yes stop_codon:yes gene_type:complete